MLAFVLVFFSVLFLFAWRLTRRAEERSALAAMLSGEAPAPSGPGRFSALAKKAASLAGDPVELQTNLELSGTGLTLERFGAVRLVACGAGALLGVLGLTRPALAPFFALAGAGLGYVLPEFLVTGRAKERRRKAGSEVMNFTELLCTALESGLSVSEALRRVSASAGGVLGEEFTRALVEADSGRQRGEALRDMSARLKVRELDLVVDTLLQAHRYGAGVAGILKAQAARMREDAKSRFTEMGKKASTKMVFPIMLFVMVPLTVIVLLPALLSIKDALKF